jgi:hypothetical protein
MRFATLLLTACCLGLVSIGAATGDSVLRWKLDIKPAEGQRNPAGRVALDVKGQNQVYWYFVYSIKNTHEEAIPLALHLRGTTDASDKVYSEGYYPRALMYVRDKFGDDVKDAPSLQGYELAPGETLRAVAVFQFRKPDSREFEERMDKITVHVAGYADPVKKMGLNFVKENLELLMHYEKKGDQYDAHREQVRYVSSEEKVKS